MKSSVKISIIIAIVAGFAFLLITAWQCFSTPLLTDCGPTLTIPSFGSAIVR
jgi:hypothetical protein